MNPIKDFSGYRTSKNYRRLWELAQTQSLICMVKTRIYPDIARTIFHKSYKNTITISARGITYLTALNVDRFVELCEGVDLEWVVPDIPSCKKLLDLYRKKRSVDGLNGRDWDAGKHAENEVMIDKIESKLT